MYSTEHETGITLTMNGFYAPQGRQIQNALKYPTLSDSYKNVNYKKLNLTNLEMETAGLYAFGKIFNHQVISINTILANRATNEFSKKPEESIERMILLSLQKIEDL